LGLAFGRKSRVYPSSQTRHAHPSRVERGFNQGSSGAQTPIEASRSTHLNAPQRRSSTPNFGLNLEGVRHA
jgi:hypothetical protein